MDDVKIAEALTKWLDDDSEHAAAVFGARFSFDHPGYDMAEMAMGFYAGYVVASKQIEPTASVPDASRLGLPCATSEDQEIADRGHMSEPVQSTPGEEGLVEKLAGIAYEAHMRTQEGYRAMMDEMLAALRAHLAERTREAGAIDVLLWSVGCIEGVETERILRSRYRSILNTGMVTVCDAAGNVLGRRTIDAGIEDKGGACA